MSFLIGIVFIGIILFTIGIKIYNSRGHGRWSSVTNPHASAEIKRTNSTFRKGSMINTSFETEVYFDDGYIYTSHKTNQRSVEPQVKTPTTIATGYSVDEELLEEIKQDAIKAHLKAVEKINKKRKN